MKIATWNVNGVRARLPLLLLWLKETSPDILCLQETKSVDSHFPFQDLEDCGYNIATYGQKGFNGVAILSKYPFDEIVRGFADEDPDQQQARYLEVVVSVKLKGIRIISLYLPNGNPCCTDKFSYKIAWMDKFHKRLKEILSYEEISLACGDYNVIPEPHDAHDPGAWVDDALFQPIIRERFRSFLALGYTDAIRSCTDASGIYTFWDYQAGARQKNNGIRIDHILLSPQAADILTAAEIDTKPRDWERPSDHTPVIVTIKA